ALVVTRLPTPRLRHVAHLGVRTRDFAYQVRDRVPPSDPFRVELTGPDGTIWIWGDGSPQSVSGPALDFCLLVTQRRNRGDLALVTQGDDADEWLDIAQAFAGPPGAGREPGAHTA
ncbi:MAG: wyosine base formation domain-containing protein, partial [Jatrophihabitantaceae bacterium]